MTAASHRRLIGRGLAAGLVVFGAALLPAFAQPSASTCGAIQNAYGPFDYRKYRDNTLTIVETHHFTPEVEALIRGKSAYLGGDLDYTLRAFPNHHRALVSILKWSEKTKSPQPPTAERPLECYFERAIRFQPDDVLARMIYASFLHKANRAAEAERQLESATSQAGDNPFTHYNIGLVYLEMKSYDRALRQAHMAYGLGFGLPALRDGLKAAGRWVEPPAAGASAPETARLPAAAASGLP